VLHLVIPTNVVYIARRYGTSVQAIMQLNRFSSTRIIVGQRLLILASQPGPSPVHDTVDGWTGRIVNLPPGSQHAYYFERSDGEGFGIGGIDDLVGRRIEELRWTGEWFLVWGTLRTDVPSYGGRYITVEYLEVVATPPTPAGNLTPLAIVGASSHLCTDRWGQYQPRMTTDGAPGTAWAEGVAGSGVGEWVLLTFPGTIEVHSSHPSSLLSTRRTTKVSQGDGFFLSAKDQPFQARYIEVAV
jgi:LysM repeat protein